MAVKVLFCFHPLFVQFNAGIAQLSAVCKQQGMETDLCLLTSSSAREFLDKAENADYLAFSSTCLADHKEAQPFMLMGQQMGKTVLLGGPWAHLGEPCQYADFICRGDGEPMMRNPTGARAWHEIATFDEDLDALPLPDYDLFDGFHFERGIPGIDGADVLPYISSRGCLYRCAFCHIAHVGAQRRVRHRVREDLAKLIGRYLPEAVFFMDALLPYTDAKWRDSWEYLRMPFFAYIRADIRRDDLQWLIDRGLRWCAFGIESGSEQYRNDVLGKSLYDDEIYRTVDLLQKHRIGYAPFYMTGTPGESFQIRTETAKMIEAIGGTPFLYEYDDLSRSEPWQQRQQ